MTRFDDQLFNDLMQEYRPALATVRRPAPRARRQVSGRVRIAGGAVALAGSITAGVAVFGGGSPAFALTDNPDGTLTVTLDRASGIESANAALHHRGDRVVIVPVGADCPSIDSFAAPQSGGTKVTMEANSGPDDSVTIDVRNLPDGETALVAADSPTSGALTLAMVMIEGAAPSCVSTPEPPPAATPGESDGPTLQRR